MDAGAPPGPGMRDLYPPLQWPPAGIFMIFLGTIIVAGNVVVLSAILRKRLRKDTSFYPLTEVDLFVVNISCFDIASGFGATFTLLYSAGDLHNSQRATNINVLLANIVGANGALISLVGLAYTRYKLIFDPDIGHTGSPSVTKKKIKRALGALWVVLVTLGSTLAASDNAVPIPSGLLSIFGSGLLDFINQLWSVVLLTVPTISIIWIYRRILQKVKADCIDDTVTKNVSRMFFLVNMAYILTLLPYASLNAWSVATMTPVSRVLDTWFYVLAFTNLLANPIIYCTCQRRYRSAVFDLPGLRYLNERFEIIAPSIGSSLDKGSLDKGPIDKSSFDKSLSKSSKAPLVSKTAATAPNTLSRSVKPKSKAQSNVPLSPLSPHLATSSPSTPSQSGFVNGLQLKRDRAGSFTAGVPHHHHHHQRVRSIPVVHRRSLQKVTTIPQHVLDSPISTNAGSTPTNADSVSSSYTTNAGITPTPTNAGSLPRSFSANGGLAGSYPNSGLPSTVFEMHPSVSDSLITSNSHSNLRHESQMT